MQTPTKQMPEHCLSIHGEHDARALLKQCPTNVTNVLTYKQLTLISNLTLSNARRGVARFRRLEDENLGPAGAARGLEAVAR